MSLVSKLSKHFDFGVRQRGRLYYELGKVEIINHSDSRIDAVVNGSDRYLVSIDLSSRSLSVVCTCPYFENAACKHLWATILEVDESDYLDDSALSVDLTLKLDRAAATELREHEDILPDDKVLTEDARRLAALMPPARTKSHPVKTSLPKPEPQPAWKTQLSALTNLVRAELSDEGSPWPAGREFSYVIDLVSTQSTGKLTVDIGYRERTMKGEWGKLKSQRIPLNQIPTIKDGADRQILTILSGARESAGAAYHYNYRPSFDSLGTRCLLTPELQRLVLPLLCATGRCRLRRFPKDDELPALEWDADRSWDLCLTANRVDVTDEYVLRGLLRSGVEEMEIASPILTADDILIGRDLRAAQLTTPGATNWINVLKRNGELRVPADQSGELIEHLLALPAIPQLQLAAELQFETVHLAPRPYLKMRRQDYATRYPYQSAYSPNERLKADLRFDYETMSAAPVDRRPGIYDRATRRFVMRDLGAEQEAVARIKALGFRAHHDYFTQAQEFELSPKNLPRAVKTLLAEGWRVEAEGKFYRSPGPVSVSVSSGIDWFELHGAVDFGDGLQAKLPALLSALKRGDGMVQLGDGSFGLLPEDWLTKYGLLASLGETNDDHLRFKPTQTGLLDALLAAEPQITSDAPFEQARAQWQNFNSIEPRDPAESFVGTLREYQREGLGWFDFLERFGFGGCLADDMGLGKTVQVLALLEGRRVKRVSQSDTIPKPSQGRRKRRVVPETNSLTPTVSLVVVPRSLIFNWQQEAERFTPALRVLTHIGAERTRGSEHFADYDLVLTTYGTLRRDAAQFKDAQFDLLILDEAQAIKNAKTESAKAARLLKGRQRLALSGTPIENHLGELWSLFEFLNPGMLGAASVFQLSGGAARAPDEETKTLLAQALRPFILRRTKQQVAKELPEKLEQTIYCEMEPPQRKRYNELRDFYRASLLDRVAQVGINRAKMYILEALLRLRQAACHPALITKGIGDEPSAKLDVLLPHLAEVVDEGHKALVFSQFTSFLSIVRRRLDQESINYEYLDGKTRDRAARVERFQKDPECKLFLISLKAGGLGLNLTVAEYVFLLDPWWNPAVEAQAIDRAHRIGQTQRVFAYRLIARGTVEEKVLELQATKRDLADSIIGANDNLIRSISKDDLLLLLS